MKCELWRCETLEFGLSPVHNYKGHYPTVDVDYALFARYSKALSEFDAVQRELSDLYTEGKLARMEEEASKKMREDILRKIHASAQEAQDIVRRRVDAERYDQWVREMEEKK